jgi:hypothetical protein
MMSETMQHRLCREKIRVESRFKGITTHRFPDQEVVLPGSSLTESRLNEMVVKLLPMAKRGF